MPAQEIWGRRSSVCVYVYIHVCRCAHMSTYGICLSIALHITFCAHHFSLTGQWALASNCPSTHPPPHIQHCSYRCIHHTWLLHRCWSSDLKSSYLLTKPSGQPSSPSLNSFGVSGYRHILSLSPDDLFFFSLRNCTNEELIYFQAISETCGWVTWSVGSMKSLRESPGKWADPNHQESPSPTMNRDRKAETATQLGAMIERKFKPWGLGGGTTERLNSSNWL